VKLELWGSERVLKHPKKAAMLAGWPGFEGSVAPVKGCEQGRLVLVDADADPPEVVALDADFGEATLVATNKAGGKTTGAGMTPGGGRGGQ